MKILEIFKNDDGSYSSRRFIGVPCGIVGLIIVVSAFFIILSKIVGLLKIDISDVKQLYILARISLGMSALFLGVTSIDKLKPLIDKLTKNKVL